MIQVYTGNGKGKTTAAIGLAVRACGAGLKVYIAQFIKGKNYSEIKALRKFRPNLTIEQFGRGTFIKIPGPVDRDLAVKGLKKVKQILSENRFDLIILDEINNALEIKLLELPSVLKLLGMAPKETEIVLTGRNAHPDIIAKADLVSEINEVKHYFKDGVKARRGIEF
ncbi:MAG: cob(I)yrinic acid a,c-diamide adenosyltransferase [Candidatus Omnitrophica bacterium]|jgi:cob(I)alamin adenosyltransferase|nr:cob(I)yrinic acid a,c-diamide adenosyltransferase [Candidatus Omnitrophota bacterium]MDD5079230.1 cob(I)yrinic acid a,c-diamide adenosyltransferase [Candidatus Omnitrophota bacterium]